MNLKKIEQIYFIGIKGVGTSALAIFAKEKGCHVAGSDVKEKFGTDIFLQKAKIRVFCGFEKKHIGDFTASGRKTLVVSTAAHQGFDNIEAKFARKKDVKVITYGQALGLFMKEKEGISVAGCHGKTTTTAIIAHLFSFGKLDPSYVVGTSCINSLGNAGHYGRGRYFIAEADEYVSDPKYDLTPKLLYQSPKIAVITNIDYDHPDVYKSKREIRNVYLKFAQNIKTGGVLIIFGDKSVRDFKKTANAKVYTYGFLPNNDLQLKAINFKNGKTHFQLSFLGKDLGDFILSINGRQNILNASAAMLTAYKAGLSWQKIKAILPTFSGTKRRFEYLGKSSRGAFVYDDYAHHPNEIKATYDAVRSQFPGKRIIAVFQPHTYSRTKTFLDDFAKSLSDFDFSVVTEIFPSAREKKDKSVSGQSIVEQSMKYRQNVVFFGNTFGKTIAILSKKVRRGDIILTMGAGDIYKIHPLLLSKC